MDGKVDVFVMISELLDDSVSCFAVISAGVLNNIRDSSRIVS